MKSCILSIDTCQSTETIVRLKIDDRVVEKKSDQMRNTAQLIIPMLEGLLQDQSLKQSDITEIEVATGPGSFTGVRVGVAIATTLSWILHIPINGRSSGTTPQITYAPSKWDD